jgi:Flp pilus assembly pilin Flp
MRVMRRLWNDDRGQDLVEYVLLGASVALAGMAALGAFPGIAQFVYSSWDTAQQNLWYPAPPAN